MQPTKNLLKKKTVFLDRDGTIIVDKVYLNDPNQIIYLPGVFEALQKLRDAGFQFVLVTNQSGVARGLVTIENLNEIHRRIRAEFAKYQIEFREIYYAPYAVDSNHPLRKPSPGMLLKARDEAEADLEKSWMIGDRLSDIIAGFRAGCKTVLLTGVEEPDSASSRESQPDIISSSLLEAAQKILSEN